LRHRGCDTWVWNFGSEWLLSPRFRCKSICFRYNFLKHGFHAKSFDHNNVIEKWKITCFVVWLLKFM